jgi:hypothetical protein
MPTPPPPLATAAPTLPSREEVLAGLESSNKVYISAFRSGDIGLLRTVYMGEALAYYEDSMRKMLARGERQDNQLVQTELIDIQVTSPTKATVRTRERWSFKVVGPSNPTFFNYSEYYELTKVGGSWLVSVNTFQQIP